MRLQWWICGRSVSVCLTLWCISTGLNPFSITSRSPLLSSSICLFFLSFSCSLTFSDFQILSGLFFGTYTSKQTPTLFFGTFTTTNNKTTNRNWALNMPILSYRGSSEIVLLIFWPNGRKSRTGDAVSDTFNDSGLVHWRQRHGSVVGTSTQMKA